jgi:type I restriction enzyme, S subunit
MSAFVAKTQGKADLQRLTPYPAYKDSGVEWLGEIPTHWQVRRLKHLAALNPESLAEDTDPTLEMLYIDIGGVDSLGRIVNKEQLTFGSSPTRARRLVRDGDVIVSTVRTYLRAIAPINDPEPGVVVSTGFAVVRPTDDLAPDYAAYALRAPYFVERVVANSKGVSFPAINEIEMATYELAVPPTPEQRAIAMFLDRETAKIDALVAKKEQLIELLQEKRAALITRAVTKGLDRNVPMRDSGVEWLGDIPAHWEVNRTKFAARLRSGHTPSRQHPEYWQDCTIPWFGLADVWQIRDGKTEHVSETAEKISEFGLANSAARLLPKGTVVLSRTASVGFSAIMDVDMATTQDFVNWVCGTTLRPPYLLYVFRSMEQEFRRLTMGSTHQTIYMPDVGRFSTPIPPLPEQDEIVAFIRKETVKLDALVGNISAAIDRMKELRTALISAAVTGKIDLREEAA